MTPEQHAKLVGALQALGQYWTAQANASAADPEMAAFCASQANAVAEAVASTAAAAPAAA